MECKACGIEMKAGQAFCSGCGALTSRSAPITSQLGGVISRGAETLSDRFDQLVSYLSAQENRKGVVIGGAALALLFAAFTDNSISDGIRSLATGAGGPSYNEDGSPNFAEYQDVFISKEAEYYVTGVANVRNFPTSEMTNIIGQLAEGNRVLAREVQPFDPSSQWLKLTSGGYVWARNLALVGADQSPSEQAKYASLIGRWHVAGNCNADFGDVLRITPDTVTHGPNTYKRDIHVHPLGIRFFMYDPSTDFSHDFILFRRDQEPGIWMRSEHHGDIIDTFFFDRSAPCSVVNGFDPYGP